MNRGGCLPGVQLACAGNFKRLLTPVFDSLENNMILTGHTDALKYHHGNYNTWNLSGDRALAARQIMKYLYLLSSQMNGFSLWESRSIFPAAFI